MKLTTALPFIKKSIVAVALLTCGASIYACYTSWATNNPSSTNDEVALIVLQFGLQNIGNFEVDRSPLSAVYAAKIISSMRNVDSLKSNSLFYSEVPEMNELRITLHKLDIDSIISNSGFDCPHPSSNCWVTDYNTLGKDPSNAQIEKLAALFKQNNLRQKVSSALIRLQGFHARTMHAS